MTKEQIIFLRLPDVERATGLRRSQIYALAKSGEFPSPVKLSTKCIGWVFAEVQDWADKRKAAARPQADSPKHNAK